jgi:glycosyltransferase involved in cell wall biosynthesis
MSKADTLVILTPGFPKDEADTTCLPPQQVFVRNLKQQHPNLTIIILAFQYPYYSAEYQWNGIRVIAFGGQNKGRANRLLIWARAMLMLRKLHKKYNLVGLLSFWVGECTLIAARFATKHDIKYYGWILGQDARSGNKFIKRIKPSGEDIIAISDFVAAEFGKNYSIQPAHVIPVGIDPVHFNSNLKRDIDILGAGSLISLKQYDLLIDLVAKLKVTAPNIKAIICGDGPERETLQMMIDSLGLTENITFTGELPHAEVLSLMTRTRVFMHPSNYEGFSTVCLEALNAGAQVVSLVRPMLQEIQNWHIAESPHNMLIIVQKLLDNPLSNPVQVTPYLAKDSGLAVMKLFDYKDSAIA